MAADKLELDKEFTQEMLLQARDIMTAAMVPDGLILMVAKKRGRPSSDFNYILAIRKENKGNKGIVVQPVAVLTLPSQLHDIFEEPRYSIGVSSAIVNTRYANDFPGHVGPRRPDSELRLTSDN